MSRAFFFVFGVVFGISIGSTLRVSINPNNERARAAAWLPNLPPSDILCDGKEEEEEETGGGGGKRENGAVPSSLPAKLVYHSTQPPTEKRGVYGSASCKSLLSNVARGILADPNEGTKNFKLTTTEPEFWISLHNKKIDHVRWSIMEYGIYYEKHLTEHFQEILQDYKQPSLVLDVGMNIGWFSLWVRALGHRAISFEPNYINRLRLCESLQRNNWTDDGDITVYKYGIGAKEEDLKFISQRSNNPGAGGFERKDDQLDDQQLESSQLLPVITLDAFADDKGWFKDPRRDPIPILKVDVEGYDAEVFKGAGRLLQSGLIKNILMEYGCRDGAEERDMRGVSEQLLKAKYVVKLIGQWSGREIPNSMQEVKRSATDFAEGLYRFCVKRNKAGLGANLNLWWELTE